METGKQYEMRELGNDKIKVRETKYVWNENQIVREYNSWLKTRFLIGSKWITAKLLEDFMRILEQLSNRISHFYFLYMYFVLHYPNFFVYLSSLNFLHF